MMGMFALPQNLKTSSHRRADRPFVSPVCRPDRGHEHHLAPQVCTEGRNCPASRNTMIMSPTRER